MELGTYITTRGNEAIKELRKEIGPEALIQTDKAYQTTMKNIEKNYENIKTAIIEALPYLHPEDIITLRDTCTVTRLTIIGKKYDMTTEQMKGILDKNDTEGRKKLNKIFMEVHLPIEDYFKYLDSIETYTQNNNPWSGTLSIQIFQYIKDTFTDAIETKELNLLISARKKMIYEEYILSKDDTKIWI